MSASLVIVESPFAAPTPEGIARNQEYLRAALRDCVSRGESPYASHALLTLPGVLDDTDPEERLRGIQLGFAWRQVAHVTCVYTDLGISRGMLEGVADARRINHLVMYRKIAGWS